MFTGNPGDVTLLKAKITVPRLRAGHIERRRLLSELDQSVSGRLTALCAPAGCGKTTLLSQWAHASKHRTAWVSLDELDNDPVRFWRYLAAALATVSQQTGAQIESLASMLPHASLFNFIEALMNEWYSLAEPVVLIVDDYHVISDRRIHESLAYAISYLPDTGHLIIGSRSDLPFSTSRWLARNQMSVLTYANMQFNQEETGAFYDRTHNLHLTPEEIRTLHERSEGWVTALQLAAVSHAGQPTLGLTIKPLEGKHAVANYLFEEVFSQLPVELQHFLLRTSILERMDANLCRAVSGEPRSQQLLQRLEAANLFLLPIDDDDASYRYHPLFAEFLRTLLRNRDPDDWRRGCCLASRACAERGMVDAAMHYALAGEDFDEAEQLLQQHMESILRQGEFTNMLRWLEHRPSQPDTVSSGWLMLHAFVLAVAGRIDQAQQVVQTLEVRLETEDDECNRASIASGVFFIRSNLLFFSGNYEEWQAYADRLGEGLLIDNGTFYSYNFNVSEPLINRTRIGLKGALSPEAEQVGVRFSQVLESHGWAYSLFNLYVRLSLAEGYYEWNRLVECQTLLDTIGAYGELETTPGLFVPHRILQTRLYMSSGQGELALAWIQEAMQKAAEYPDQRWLSALRAIKAQVHLSRMEIGKARQDVSLLHLSLQAIPTLRRETEYLAWARFLGQQRKYSQAIQMLEQLLPQAQREGLVSSMIEIGLLLAMLHDQRGQRTVAMHQLSGVLGLAYTNGYIRSFLDTGGAVIPLLQAYLQSHRTSQQTELTSYVRELLAKLLADESVDQQATRPASPPLDEPLTESELGMLSLVRRGASNKQIAAELALSEGTVRVYLSRLYAKLGVSSRTQALQIAQEKELF
ncbi:LuxR C-terminal-related transcriptional regulator [Paenibacillus daejeonensis]|uniref:LuxR C-terminal-related transcriptional regulator n=1 Tax=Paenibacillus daejeonensis TaxID=135193 RepID=UPI0003605310|nr:LuxR C-terminal-related transcriptional regulator [Paenibacillus daejeonensis]